MKARLREKYVGEENASGREVRRLKGQFEAEEVEGVVEALCGVGGLVPVGKK